MVTSCCGDACLMLGTAGGSGVGDDKDSHTIMTLINEFIINSEAVKIKQIREVSYGLRPTRLA